jgi:hypothetical protein
VYYHDGSGQLQSLPAAWTSVVAEDPVVIAGAGQSAFRVADLLALARLLAGISPSFGLDHDEQAGPGGVK